MAHHKSALKRIRQTAKRTVRNASLRSNLRNTIKKYRAELESGNVETAKANYPQVQKAIGRAVSKGIIKSTTAARYTSRLAQALNRASA